MRNFTKLMLALGLFITSTGCKSESEKRADRVDDTRERLAEKQQDVREEHADVREAQKEVREAHAALDQARTDFIQALDAQLRELENKIVLAKAKPGFEAARVIQLQGEAATLRAQAADERRTFSREAHQAELDRITREIRDELP